MVAPTNVSVPRRTAAGGGPVPNALQRGELYVRMLATGVPELYIGDANKQPQLLSGGGGGAGAGGVTITLAAAAPAAPSATDLWYRTSAPVGLYIYDGAAWVDTGEGVLPAGPGSPAVLSINAAGDIAWDAPSALDFSAAPTYADDAAAATGGLTTGAVYKTTTGQLRVKL